MTNFERLSGDQGRARGRAFAAALALLTLALPAAAWGQAEPELVPLTPGSDLPEDEVPPRSGDVTGGAEADAAPGEVRHAVAFRFGASYNVLNRPGDVPGDDTILAGSAFTGPGFFLGLTYELRGLAPRLALEFGLLYSRATATGFETRGEDYMREVLLTVDALRVPWSAKYRLPLIEPLTAIFGAGFDINLGLASASEVRERGVPAREQLFLETRSVPSLDLSAVVGLEVDVGQVQLPLEVRAGFNPFVGDKTVDRFDNYIGPNERGQYRVEFDYSILFLLGVAYGI